MAEEILLLTVRLAADSKNAKTVQDLVKVNKELAKVIAQAPREGTEEYEKMKDTLAEAKRQYAANAKEIAKFNKELKTGEKELEQAEDSLFAMSKILKELERDYKSLSAADRKTTSGLKLKDEILKTRQALLQAEKGLGDFRRQVGDYGRVVIGLSPALSAIAASTNELSSGLKNLTLGFKNASTSAKAFLLTIAPLAAAVAAISFALSKFEGVRDAFERGFAGIAAAGNVVIERIGLVAFSFEKLLSLDFKGFREDIGAAFTGLTDEIKNDFNAASEFTRQLQELDDRRIASIVRLAELERDISEAKREAEEKAATDRKAAAADIQTAINLTEQQREIELRLAQERATIFEAQVRQKGELASDEEQEKANQARAEAIKLEASFNNELRGLIRRRNQLSKETKEKNQDELNALQQLLKKQAELTEAIKLQILANEDSSASIKEFGEVTAKILEVESKFKELTDGIGKSIDFSNQSLTAYNDTISKLNNELQRVNIGSEQYLNIQNQILVTEAEREAKIGNITKSLEELNRVQMANIATLEDAQTELFLRSQAQAQIEAIQDSANAADEKLAIEEKLQSDLQQLRINRIEDEKQTLDSELVDIDNSLKKELELYANNELKKQELSLIAQGKRDEIRQRQLELEAELLEIGVQKYDDAERKKTEAAQRESDRQKEIRDLAIDTSVQAAGKILELISTLQEQNTQKQNEEITKRENKELEEAERLGKTEEQKQAIRERFAKEREELEKKSAAERKAIAISEAIIDIAGAVLNALNSPAPANVGLAAAAAALGAIQLAIISATNFADGGLVQPIKLGNGKIINAPNIPALSNGDNIVATVKKGEVILNERQQKALGGAETFKRIGVPGFSKGGHVTDSLPYSTGQIMPTFRKSVLRAKAFANGGSTSTISTQTNKLIKSEIDILAAAMFEAVRQGAAIGSKEGTENADITGQIAKQNERTARRQEQEKV